ncbi:maltoporin [Photobacterium carnosum]|uniref:carbohydrate porin n=1 Tax=Photobacterium carnosum TaxID=2023717 RepID=UPI001C905130|nr:carbohydrate porin [Photobacterium carnosum]MBY3788057.1 maltoporin [Photobacterium carnosum]MCD9532974.1 maltoporin [Photobacterium carnosum]
MKFTLMPIAAALLAALTSTTVFAADTQDSNNVDADVIAAETQPVDSQAAVEMLTDGWEVHGYGSMNYRSNSDFQSFDSELGKPDYRTAGTSGKSANQVELTVKKKTAFSNGVKSDFVVRAEYGNGDSYYYSSPGAEKTNTVAQFEVKEAYVALSNLPYLGEGTEIWAGRRYFNRAAGILTGEFWKQSSGMGAGFETTLANENKMGIALVSADPEAGHGINWENPDFQPARPVDGDRTTVHSLDLYYYNVKALGGSFDFDAKIMKRADEKLTGDQAKDGYGFAVTYNRDYYGLDGWTQTALAYGHGMASNRGVNFGQWSGDWQKNSKSWFATSYGVLNINDRWQMGSELTYWAPQDMKWGATSDGKDKVTRFIAAFRPTYKVNNNFRVEMTGSYAMEKVNGNNWGREDNATNFYSLELAPVFTVNADYFGRPQIKPYITWVSTSDEAAAGAIGITDANKKDQVVFGIQAEIWF